MKTYLIIEKCDAYQAIVNHHSNVDRFNEILKKSTIKTEYDFDDLSDEAKEKAVQNLYDINIDYNWWESTYEDAKRIGLKITGFDLERKQDITGNRLFDMDTICDNIIKDHGEKTETYKIASSYKEKSSQLVDDDDYDDNYNKLSEDFEDEILDAYFDILKNEYKYLTSKESIIETIKANNYQFDEEGKLC